MAKSKKCSKGSIKRRSYNAKRGSKKVHVKAACIKATSYKGMKRSDSDKKKIARRNKSNKKISRKYKKPKCDTNQIMRTGYSKKGYKRQTYVRKDGTPVKPSSVKRSEVAPACILDKGKAGKGYRVPVILQKNDLKKFGYGNIKNITIEQRRNALARATMHYKKPLPIYRKLIYLSTLNKNTNPATSKKIRSDAKWLKENYGLASIGSQ